MKFPRIDLSRGVVFALTAAALFGGSTPFAKLLLGRVEPVLLAGLLYLGSGSGLVLWKLVSSLWKGRSAEASLGRADLGWLCGAILAGGVVGPVLLMVGLSHTPASSASLLLNLESVLTAALAWFVFRENFDRRIAVGMAAICIGGLVLSWEEWPEFGLPWGSLTIVGACLAWGIDNNLTRKVSAGDPVQIAAVKGIVAGTVNLAVALSIGARLPDLDTAFLCSAVGFLGYGVSLTCFVLGLRYLGTARTGAYFSVAPFIGAVVSLVIFRDSVTVWFLLAATLMGAGLWLHLTESHHHEHEHEPLEHDHRHVHDQHHQHEHDSSVPPGEPHNHPHRHTALRHSHPHYPDIHHRHEH